MNWTEILANSQKGTPRIRVVADENCPSCRAPGSPKVCDINEVWHWKCSTPYANCKVGYWVPGTTTIEYKLPPEEAADFAKKIHDQITEQLKNRIWICDCNGSGFSSSTTIPEGDPIPPGHHRLGEGCN